jgi:hypothetical protein
MGIGIKEEEIPGRGTVFLVSPKKAIFYHLTTITYHPSSPSTWLCYACGSRSIGSI